MSSWKRWLIGLAILLVVIFTLKFAYEEATADFSLKNISHDLPFEAAWEVPSPSPEQLIWLKQILNQPYNWLGQGHQVFAFSSEDQKYVLKIFKFKRLKPSWETDFFAGVPYLGPYYAHLNDKRLRRIQKLFRGHKLAYLNDKENTGMLFMHLDNRKRDLNLHVTVVDKIGFSHDLDLDSLVFVIQEKGTKTKDVLTALLDQGDVKGVQEHIAKMFDLYIDEYKKGFMDQDHNVMLNTGFVGTKPIRIDVGQLKYDESFRDPSIQKSDLSRIAWERFSPWIKKNYPQYQSEIDLFMQKKLSEIFGEKN